MNLRRTSIALAAVSTVVSAGVAGGIAWADGNGSDGGNAGGRVAPASTQSPKGPAQLLSAQIGADHTVIRGRGVKKVVAVGTGTNRVRFNRNVAGCVYTGSLTDSGLGNGDVGLIALASDGASPKGVYVETYDPSGNLVDSDFSLVVVC